MTLQNCSMLRPQSRRLGQKKILERLRYDRKTTLRGTGQIPLATHRKALDIQYAEMV
jgi:hypothetical protein